MPLETRIVRDGAPLTMPWGSFHVAAMIVAASIDSGQGPFDDNTVTGVLKPDHEPIDYPDQPIPLGPGDAFRLCDYAVIARTPLSYDGYVLKAKHHFVDTSDEEDLVLLPGDKLVAYRTGSLGL